MSFKLYAKHLINNLLQEEKSSGMDSRYFKQCFDLLNNLIDLLDKAKNPLLFIRNHYATHLGLDTQLILDREIIALFLAANASGKNSLIFVEPGYSNLKDYVRKYIAEGLPINCFITWRNAESYVVDYEVLKDELKPELLVFLGSSSLEALLYDQNGLVLKDLLKGGGLGCLIKEKPYRSDYSATQQDIDWRMKNYMTDLEKLVEDKNLHTQLKPELILFSLEKFAENEKSSTRKSRRGRRRTKKSLSESEENQEPQHEQSSAEESDEEIKEDI